MTQHQWELDEEQASENRKLQGALDAKLTEEDQKSPSQAGDYATFTAALMELVDSINNNFR